MTSLYKIILRWIKEDLVFIEFDQVDWSYSTKKDVWYLKIPWWKHLKWGRYIYNVYHRQPKLIVYKNTETSIFPKDITLISDSPFCGYIIVEDN